MNQEINLELFKGTKSQIDDLYTTINSRKYNISNDVFVEYIDHKKFCKKNPYRKWFLIRNKSNYIGSIYITYHRA